MNKPKLYQIIFICKLLCNSFRWYVPAMLVMIVLNASAFRHSTCFHSSLSIQILFGESAKTLGGLVYRRDNLVTIQKYLAESII